MRFPLRTGVAVLCFVLIGHVSGISSSDKSRAIKNAAIENLNINGRVVTKADQARFYAGDHVEGLTFTSGGDNPSKNQQLKNPIA